MRCFPCQFSRRPIGTTRYDQVRTIRWFLGYRGGRLIHKICIEIPGHQRRRRQVSAYAWMFSGPGVLSGDLACRLRQQSGTDGRPPESLTRNIVLAMTCDSATGELRTLRMHGRCIATMFFDISELSNSR